MACAASIAFACGPKEPSSPVGISTRGGDLAEDAAPDGGEGAPPPTFPPDFRTRFTKINHGRFASRGHGSNRFWLDVYANDAARAGYAQTSGDVPIGAMFVADGYEPSVAGQGVRGPILMMEKRARGYDPENGDWRYAVVEASGKVSADGKLALCFDCHEGALPRDRIFVIVE